jgi:hypothetical protein
MRSIEIFIIAHEYGHFIAHEGLASTASPQCAEESIEIELYCDALGIFLSQTIATEEENYFSTSGAGAVILFRLMQLCDEARTVYVNSSSADQEGRNQREPNAIDSHPSYQERIDAVRELALAGTKSGQRKSLSAQLDFYDSASASFGKFACKVIRNVFEASSKG